MKVAAIIPTLNAASLLPPLLDAISSQTLQASEIIVVDSNSRDCTAAIARERGARVLTLGERKFNHGGTRKWASEQTDADILIYLTHDALPADPDAFRIIVDALSLADDAGMAYGRQIPYENAGPLARHHRQFNYPEGVQIKRLADKGRLGIKTCWASDSFAAYRAEALRAIGGFPTDVIACEDVWVGAKMILAGYSIVYAGNARVRHSHDYSIVEEFRRYFDNGVFYGQNPWISASFGGASGEGLKFVQSELGYLLRTGHAWLAPKAIMATVAKMAGFRAGHLERYLPFTAKRRLGMFGGYWTQPAE